ncbi:MAG: S24/S26 family peptidase [Fusicatenibacter saccharivorans]
MYTYDIEQLLKDGSAIRLKPQGYSMYPLFHPGRDEAVIEAYPIHLLRRGDIILYRREQGILVLTGSAASLRMAFIWSGTTRPKSKGRSARIRSVGS